MSGLPADVVGRLTELAHEVESAPPEAPAPSLSDQEFDHLAHRVFEHQYGANEVYRAFCDGRGAHPGRWEGWAAVPAVPTRAFQQFEFVSGDPDKVERVFQTSGTTGGSASRGRHPVLSIDLYRTLSLPWFRRHLLPEGGGARILSLIPSAEDRPESSLATMVDFVLQEHADADSAVLVEADHRLRADAAVAALRDAEAAGSPVLILGTAFSFVHLLDHLRETGLEFDLPETTRIMETGGFKGRSRTVERSELYREIKEGLGVAEARIINEYGMTELLSQFYEPVLAGGVRAQCPAPWTRTRILDPASLAALAPGSEGILAHFDLANVGSVSSILTQDLGTGTTSGHPGSFTLSGRIPGAEPRGCSLAVEQLLAAAR